MPVLVKYSDEGEDAWRSWECFTGSHGEICGYDNCQCECHNIVVRIE